MPSIRARTYTVDCCIISFTIAHLKSTSPQTFKENNSNDTTCCKLLKYNSCLKVHNAHLYLLSLILYLYYYKEITNIWEYKVYS